MHATRREMLRLGLGSSGGILGLPRVESVPLFLARSAHALAGAPSAGKARILVVVQLDGGNDGLNTVVPRSRGQYRKQRPKLAISESEVKKIDDRVGLHPTLEPFSKLLEQGRLAIVQGVSCVNPNRSRTSTAPTIWHTAKTDG